MRLPSIFIVLYEYVKRTIMGAKNPALERATTFSLYAEKGSREPPRRFGVKGHFKCHRYTFYSDPHHSEPSINATPTLDTALQTLRQEQQEWHPQLKMIPRALPMIYIQRTLEALT